MLRNRDLKFHCEHVCIRVEQTDTPFTARAPQGAGAADSRSRTAKGTTTRNPTCCDTLEPTGRVVFRYCDARGQVTDAANPNGALNGIAGICNEQRNVVGLMPHPERACEPALGSADGLVLFESVVTALAGQRRPSHHEPKSIPPSSNATASSPTSTTASSARSDASRR